LDEEGTDKESSVAENSEEGWSMDESTSAIAMQPSSLAARPAAQNSTSEEDEEVSPTASLSLAAEIHGEDDEPYDRKTEKLSQSPKAPLSLRNDESDRPSSVAQLFGSNMTAAQTKAGVHKTATAGSLQEFKGLLDMKNRPALDSQSNAFSSAGR
jgi:hypothetical protein